MMTPQEVIKLVESKAEGLEVSISQVLRKTIRDRDKKFFRYHYRTLVRMQSEDGFKVLAELIGGFESQPLQKGVWIEEGGEYDIHKSWQNIEGTKSISWSVSFDLVSEDKI